MCKIICKSKEKPISMGGGDLEALIRIGYNGGTYQLERIFHQKTLYSKILILNSFYLKTKNITKLYT